MPIDAFLYFEGPGNAAIKIEGESTDSHFKAKKAFEINSYSFGVENVATIGSKSGGSGAGKANFEPFEVVKNLDTGSPMIFQASAMGCHFASVYLALRRAGGEEESAKPYLVFQFKLVFINSVKWSGSGDDVPEETLSFGYGAMQIEYYAQNKDGTMDTTPIIGQWSQILNKKSAEIA
jgi:type VI secretion system secreted protein Hcp